MKDKIDGKEIKDIALGILREAGILRGDAPHFVYWLESCKILEVRPDSMDDSIYFCVGEDAVIAYLSDDGRLSDDDEFIQMFKDYIVGLGRFEHLFVKRKVLERSHWQAAMEDLARVDCEDDEDDEDDGISSISGWCRDRGYVYEEQLSCVTFDVDDFFSYWAVAPNKRSEFLTIVYQQSLAGISDAWNHAIEGTPYWVCPSYYSIGGHPLSNRFPTGDVFVNAPTEEQFLLLTEIK